MAIRNTYKPGDHLIQCERTGFVIYRSEARKEWTGHLVRRGSSEPRHPQEFVRGVEDHQAVFDGRPQPRTPADYPRVGPVVTYLATGAAFGATSIDVESSTGMTVNDTLKIGLNTNAIQTVTLSNIATNTLTITPGLAATATEGGLVQDFSAAITATGGY